MNLYQSLFYADFTDQLCADQNMVRLMVQVELALVEAQAKNKLIPLAFAKILEGILERVEIDMEALQKAIPLTGNAAAPLVKQLIAIVKKENEEAAKYIHLGATSQDIVDTTTVLKFKHFLGWLEERLEELENILIQLAKQYRSTFMMGRTLMQQAKPITFGLKTALWLQGIRHSKQNLLAIKNQLLCVQLGGAVGSQNQYITHAVRQTFAEILALKDIPSWHTQRSHIAIFASTLGVLTGSLGKVANDIVLLSQTEVDEVREPSAKGRGTSSTMPHKRNPVLSTAILANAHRIPFLVASMLAALPQELERSAGLWHAEWETMDDILGLTAGAIEKSIELLKGLEVNEKRMIQNIEHSKGLIFAETVALALAQKMGKAPAHHLIETACQQAIEQGQHLRAVLEKMKLDLSQKELKAFFQPENAIGQSLQIIDEILARK